MKTPDHLRRLLGLLLASLLLTGCATRQATKAGSSINNPTVTETLNLADGTKTSRVDNRGKSATEEGRTLDTNAPEWLVKLSESLTEKAGFDPIEGGLTYFENQYSLVDEGNLKLIEELSTTEKGIREEMSLLAKAGTAAAQQKYVELGKQLLTVGSNLIDAQARANAGPKGDRAGMHTRGLSIGKNHNAVALAAVDTFGRSVVSRHTNQNTFESTRQNTYLDTTSSGDVAVVTAGLVAIYDEPDRESVEAGKPFENDPATVNPPPSAGESGTLHYGPEAMARVRRWYPNANLGGGNNDAVARGVGLKFLWKPASDSNGKLAIHTPNTWHVLSVKVGDEVRTGPDGIGNGYRPLWRFGKPGSAYGSPVTVELSVNGKVHTITIPNGGTRFDKEIGSPPAPTATAPAAPVQSNAPATLTPGGALQLRADAAALVQKVLVLTNAKTPSETEKYVATRTGNTWSTGTSLQALPGAVYQIWWTAEPPSDVPHHQAFPSPAGPAKVSHVNQAGEFDPPTTRSP